MFPRLSRTWQRIFTIIYEPRLLQRDFLERSQTQETPPTVVTAAVLTALESRQVFGVPLARRSIQPVYLRIVNRHTSPLRLYVLEIDPHYYTPLEAACLNHFSVLRRISTFGIAALVFLPLLLLLPLKLWAAARANRRMDETFRSAAFPLRPIAPGATVEGYVYTSLDAGSKTVRICLFQSNAIELSEIPRAISELQTQSNEPISDFTFTLPVPGIKADYLHRNLDTLHPPHESTHCDLRQLAQQINELPPATTNHAGQRPGDPVNLVVIGEFETMLSAFTARWDESETITLGTCWKTARAFLFGSEYRYSPVSPLYLFGRSQDIALQRVRSSINERLHLRLWLTPLRFMNHPVWVGQISRDIGVRFTTRTWNLTTHRVDPNVDESRDYLVEDLLRAERVFAVGYAKGVGPCPPDAPRYNLCDDPYFTDGKRAVIALSHQRAKPRYVAWG